MHSNTKPNEREPELIAPEFVQAGIWKRWGREAARLFRLYWQTNDERHLAAFTTHVRGMRLYGGPQK